MTPQTVALLVAASGVATALAAAALGARLSNRSREHERREVAYIAVRNQADLLHRNLTLALHDHTVNPDSADLRAALNAASFYVADPNTKQTLIQLQQTVHDYAASAGGSLLAGKRHDGVTSDLWPTVPIDDVPRHLAQIHDIRVASHGFVHAARLELRPVRERVFLWREARQRRRSAVRGDI